MRIFNILGLLLMITVVSESGVIPPRDGTSGEDKKLSRNPGIWDPEVAGDDFGIYEFDTGVSKPPADDDYSKPSEGDKATEVDENKPGIIKPEIIPPNEDSDENPVGKRGDKDDENDSSKDVDKEDDLDKKSGDEGFYEPFDGEEDADKSVDNENKADDLDKKSGDEGFYEPFDGEEDADKSVGDEGKEDEEYEDKAKDVDESDSEEDDDKEVPEAEDGDGDKKAPEEDDKKVPEDDDDDKKVPEEEEDDDDKKAQEEDDKEIPKDADDKKVPEDDDKKVQEEDDSDDKKLVKDDDDKDKNIPEENYDKKEHAQVDKEIPGEKDVPKDEEKYIPVKNDEESDEDEHDKDNEESDEDEHDEDGENIDEGKESGFFSEGSIFDTPIFNLNKIQKYFHQLERALGHVFRQTLDEALLLNGTYTNTTEEEVDIDGKKYVVHKSVIQSADNHSSIYIEALTSKSKMDGTEEIKDLDINNVTDA